MVAEVVDHTVQPSFCPVYGGSRIDISESPWISRRRGILSDAEGGMLHVRVREQRRDAAFHVASPMLPAPSSRRYMGDASTAVVTGADFLALLQGLPHRHQFRGVDLIPTVASGTVEPTVEGITIRAMQPLECRSLVTSCPRHAANHSIRSRIHDTRRDHCESGEAQKTHGSHGGVLLKAQEC